MIIQNHSVIQRIGLKSLKRCVKVYDLFLLLQRPFNYLTVNLPLDFLKSSIFLELQCFSLF